MSKTKKLISIFKTYLLIVEASMKNTLVALERISCIYYPFWFKRDKIKTLINSSSKVNTMALEYTTKLLLEICYTNIRAQKIDDFNLKKLKIVLANFQVENQLERAYFFQKIFFLTDISVEIVLRMFFLIFSNANI